MNIRRNFLIFLFILIGLGTGFSAFAASGTCPTDNGAGVVCSGGTPYFCSALSGCSAPSQCANWSGSVCSSVVEAAGFCPVNCNSADSCGFCNNCTTGNTLCGAYPAQTCKANVVVPTGCSSYDQCTNICSACSAGYELVTGTCVGATLKLGVDSVTGTFLKNSTNPLMSIFSTGFVGVGLTNPSSKLHVAGATGLINTGSTQLSLFAGAGNVVLMADNAGTLYQASLSTFLSSFASSTSLWGGTKDGNIWNGAAGAGNVGIGTTGPVNILDVKGAFFTSTYSSTAGVRFHDNVYGINLGGIDASSVGVIQGSAYSIGAANIALQPNGGNVGIGTTTPTSKLHINGEGKIINGNLSLDEGRAVVWRLNGTDTGWSTGSIDTTGYKMTLKGHSGFTFITNQGNSANTVMQISGLQGFVGVGGAPATTNFQVSQNTAGVGGVSNSAGGTTVTGDSNCSFFVTFKIGDTITIGGEVKTISSITSSTVLDVSTPFVSAHTNAAYTLTGGARLSVLGNGNIGIGTTAPGTKLDVSGNFRNSLATTHTLLAGSGNVIVMADNTGTLFSTSSASFASTNSLWGGTKNGNIWNGDAGVGNVGMGTTAPGGSLEVFSNLSGSGFQFGYKGTGTITSSDNHVYGMYMGQTLAPGNGKFGLTLYGGGTIAVTSPNAVNGAAIYAAVLGKSGTGTVTNAYGLYVDTQTIGTNNYNIYSNGAGQSYFGGNVGIGTTNPISKLDIYGDVSQNGSVISTMGAWSAVATTSNWYTVGYLSSARAYGEFLIENITSSQHQVLKFIASIQYGNGSQINVLENSFYSNAPFTKIRIARLSTDVVYGAYAVQVYGVDLSGVGLNNRVRISNTGREGWGVKNFTITENSSYVATSAEVSLSNQTTVQSGNMIVNGNVGIGLTNPTSKLHIAGATGLINTGNTQLSMLGGAGIAVVMTDDAGTLSSASISSLATQPMFATSTVITYTGSQGGGSYTNANAKCAAVVSGSHVCTTGEIFNTINSGHTADIPISTLWINNGPPGYIANANDCMGWNSAIGTDYGTVWVKTASGDGFGSLQDCSNSRKYACCK